MIGSDESEPGVRNPKFDEPCRTRLSELRDWKGTRKPKIPAGLVQKFTSKTPGGRLGDAPTIKRTCGPSRRHWRDLARLWRSISRPPSLSRLPPSADPGAALQAPSIKNTARLKANRTPPSSLHPR
jgi:hypothetical protein